MVDVAFCRAIDRGAVSAPDRIAAHLEAGEPDLPSPASRFIALLLALILGFSVAASSFTVAEDFHHHCTGDGCTVCAQMAGCLHIARGGVTLAAVAALIAVLRILYTPSALGDEHGRFSLTTLVALGVQLND